MKNAVLTAVRCNESSAYENSDLKTVFPEIEATLKRKIFEICAINKLHDYRRRNLKSFTYFYKSRLGIRVAK